MICTYRLWSKSYLVKWQVQHCYDRLLIICDENILKQQIISFITWKMRYSTLIEKWILTQLSQSSLRRNILVRCTCSCLFLRTWICQSLSKKITFTSPRGSQQPYSKITCYQIYFWRSGYELLHIHIWHACCHVSCWLDYLLVYWRLQYTFRYVISYLHIILLFYNPNKYVYIYI